MAIFFRVVEDAPLIVGANREEFYARAGAPPRILDDRIPIVAGVDPVAGGTWFGVNACGLLAAVTNRGKSEIPPQPRSRGLLVRDLLGTTSVDAALKLAVRELGTKRYAGCNLLLADQGNAVVIQAGDWLRVRPLPTGLHVMTAHDVNDTGDRRLGHALWWLGQRRYATAEHCVSALKQLCAQTGNGDPPICLRGPDRGTVSSTIAVLRPTLHESRYLHAQGPPDRTAYDDYSALLEQLVQAHPEATN